MAILSVTRASAIVQNFPQAQEEYCHLLHGARTGGFAPASTICTQTPVPSLCALRLLQANLYAQQTTTDTRIAVEKHPETGIPFHSSIEYESTRTGRTKGSHLTTRCWKEACTPEPTPTQTPTASYKKGDNKHDRFAPVLPQT